MSDSLEKLNRFLIKHDCSQSAEIITADASTRDYFRIIWNGESAIACVYQESFKRSESTYIDVTDLFLAAELPVAKIRSVDEQLGIIIQEDFGDTILRDVLIQAEKGEKDRLMNGAINLIAEIQSATDLAYRRNSIASQLKFDTEKLNWELNFFKEHYFNTFKREPLEVSLEKALSSELLELAAELDKRAKVLCHRDFHVANLMVKDGDLKVIDHQDARIGTITYDLVSLLLDRLTDMPNMAYIESKIDHFINAVDDRSLYEIDRDDFRYEFRLQTIQRCLKAVGTFSFQSVNRGKTYFIPYIDPTLQIVGQTAKELDRFPTIQRLFLVK